MTNRQLSYQSKFENYNNAVLIQNGKVLSMEITISKNAGDWYLFRHTPTPYISKHYYKEGRLCSPSITLDYSKCNRGNGNFRCDNYIKSDSEMNFESKCIAGFKDNGEKYIQLTVSKIVSQSDKGMYFIDKNQYVKINVLPGMIKLLNFITELHVFLDI